MNLHTPERQTGEAQEDYRVRQQMSRNAVDASQALPTTFARFKRVISLRTAHRTAVADKHVGATHPKFDAPRKHKPAQPIKPTWPASKDQRAQSRPLIVLGPHRERDALKREKPKSAVTKRMDRPTRVNAIDRGHKKLMAFFGTV